MKIITTYALKIEFNITTFLYYIFGNGYQLMTFSTKLNKA